jgi:hypothetical protein
MTIGRKSASSTDDLNTLNDGSATQRLRDSENAAGVSRRGVLWRTGLATAGGIGALSLIDAPPAEAAVNGNFVLATGNSANATTTLTAAADLPNGLLVIDGAPMGVTDTTMVVHGPVGGRGLVVDTGAGPSGTVGLALNVSAAGGSTAVQASSGSATAVAGSSASGVGVAGASTSGTGVKASSTSGTALSVVGKAKFSRSGSASVGQGGKSKTVTVPGMKSTSLVLATLQTSVTGVYIAAAVPASGKFTVHLNKNTPAAAKFAWFVLN